MDPKVEEAITKKVVEEEKGKEIEQAAKAQEEAAKKEDATNTKMEKQFAAENNAKQTEDDKKPTAEEAAKFLEDKINKIVKENKDAKFIAVAVDKKKAKAEDELKMAEWKRRDAEVKAEIAAVEQDTENQEKIAAEKRARAAHLRKHMSDEEWVANMPEHHLDGYVQLKSSDAEPKTEKHTNANLSQAETNLPEDNENEQELEQAEQKADKEGQNMIQKDSNDEESDNDESENEDEGNSDSESEAEDEENNAEPSQEDEQDGDKDVVEEKKTLSKKGKKNSTTGDDKSPADKPVVGHKDEGKPKNLKKDGDNHNEKKHDDKKQASKK